LIAGLEKPDSGAVEFGAGIGGRPVSYVFQQDLLVPWLTVAENLRLCLRDPSAKARSLADWPLCRSLGLHLIENKKPFQLSGGMRKKVNFARGFINGDPLVLMDEPFGALDPAQKREIQRGFLSVMKEGRTAVLVTHDIGEALLVCDRISFLSMKNKRLSESLPNPFRGRFDVKDLFAESGYRELYQKALDFYDEERRTT
jgi:NitT/TauT family transport system ATP-binding protein